MLLFPEFSQNLLNLAARVKERHLTPSGKVRVYFAHALTGVSEKLLEPAEEIKRQLEASNGKPAFEIMHFFGLGETPPGVNEHEFILETDLEYAVECDLLVGIHITPSYGPGGEVHVRAMLGLPTLFLHPKGTLLTRFMRGMTRWGPHAVAREYESPEEAVEHIRTTTLEMIPTLKYHPLQRQKL